MTLITSGSTLTAARPWMRPAITSRPARAGASGPAGGGARARERSGPDGTQPGRHPDGGRKAADVYKLLLAAEPHATAERKRELRTEAVRKARQSPLFFDLTLSLSKSISIFHASLGENG